MIKYKFGKDQRVRSNLRFREIMSRKLCVCDDNIVIFAAQNGLSYSRAGMSVGKKFGNAVMRNRLKRLLREAFRLTIEKIPAGYDFILMYNSKLADPIKNQDRQIPFSQVKDSFEFVIGKFNKRIGS